MSGWTRLEGVAAPLPADDIDTDVIFPARYLLRLEKQGLGNCLFHGHRFAPDGSRNAEFVLNCPPYESARFLVAGANFGCGSSREHAVWALADFGIRCVIARSFGDIFAANCARNGVLALALPEADHARVLAAARRGVAIALDLDARTLDYGAPAALSLSLDARLRRSLMDGLDEIGVIEADDMASIAQFERRQRHDAPWLSRAEIP